MGSEPEASMAEPSGNRVRLFSREVGATDSRIQRTQPFIAVGESDWSPSSALVGQALPRRPMRSN